MNITIQDGDIQADGELIVNALATYLTVRANRARFDWLYKRNPHGRVKVWLAKDGDGDLVGTAAAFPRRLYIGREERTGWVLGDFCVRNGYRSLGPALMLQRALLQAVDSGAVPLGYDFPSSAMMAVYKRLGVKAAGRMIRMAKPMRVNRVVRQHIKSEALAGTMSALGNIVLAVRNRRSQKDPSLNFDLHEHRCGEEFTSLADSLKDVYGPCVRRDADYLNWRYLESTYCTLRMITARRGGRLVGYAIFAHIDEDGIIVDLFGYDDPAIARGLIDEAGQLLKKEGVVTLSVELFEFHPWVPIFKQTGFVPRDEKPLVLYWSPGEKAGLELLAGRNWYFMGGDRDS